MKSFLSVIMAIVALAFAGCEPAATFDKPQPDNTKSLTAFPRLLQGNYLDENHTSIVTITDKLITRRYDFESKEHKNEIDVSFQIIGDTLIHHDDGTTEKITLDGDSIIQHAFWIDTLFLISADNILKKFKGYYFLNSRYNENGWEVKKMYLQKGKLTLASILSSNDIVKLKGITETSADTVSTQFNLTKKQFKKFVKQEGFTVEETFIRM